MKNLNKILLIVSVVLAVLLVGGASWYIYQEKVKNPNSQKLAQKAIDFINENVLTEGTTASLVSVKEENGLLKIRLKIGTAEYDSFITKDGKYLFPSAYDLTQTQQGSSANQEMPKADKPDVKLFVMSYCPYGLQAEKMFLPVYNLLKDRADMGIYFVNYAMHEKEELDENLRQYCIEKDQGPKYAAYLSCFVKEGAADSCLSEAQIDKSKLNSCVLATDAEYKITEQYNDKSTWLSGQFPKFDVNSDLNAKYGVQGSPTIIINEKEIEVAERSPEKFKEIVCLAFNSPPEECNEVLSSDVASPSFGSETGTDNSGGGCAQ